VGAVDAEKVDVAEQIVEVGVELCPSIERTALRCSDPTTQPREHERERHEEQQRSQSAPRELREQDHHQRQRHQARSERTQHTENTRSFHRTNGEDERPHPCLVSRSLRQEARRDFFTELDTDPSAEGGLGARDMPGGSRSADRSGDTEDAPPGHRCQGRLRDQPLGEANGSDRQAGVTDRNSRRRSCVSKKCSGPRRHGHGPPCVVDERMLRASAPCAEARAVSTHASSRTNNEGKQTFWTIRSYHQGRPGTFTTHGHLHHGHQPRTSPTPCVSNIAARPHVGHEGL
jgi:hypothetical protein